MKTAQEIRKELELERQNQRWKQIYHSYYLLKFYMEHCFPSFDKHLGNIIEKEIIRIAKDRGRLRPFSVNIQYHLFDTKIIHQTKNKQDLLEHIILSGVLEYDKIEPKINRLTRERFYDDEMFYKNHLLFRPLLEFVSRHGYKVTTFNASRYLDPDNPDSVHKYHMTFTLTL